MFQYIPTTSQICSFEASFRPRQRVGNVQYRTRPATKKGHCSSTCQGTVSRFLFKPVSRTKKMWPFSSHPQPTLSQQVCQVPTLQDGVNSFYNSLYSTGGLYDQSRSEGRLLVHQQHYLFQAMPFGLTSAPRIFTKVLEALIDTIRHQGIHIFPYLDDILIFVDTAKKATQATQLCIRHLIRHGWIINYQKKYPLPQSKSSLLGHDSRLQTSMYLSTSRENHQYSRSHFISVSRSNNCL